MNQGQIARLEGATNGVFQTEARTIKRSDGQTFTAIVEEIDVALAASLFGESFDPREKVMVHFSQPCPGVKPQEILTLDDGQKIRAVEPIYNSPANPFWRFPAIKIVVNVDT